MPLCVSHNLAVVLVAILHIVFTSIHVCLCMCAAYARILQTLACLTIIWRMRGGWASGKLDKNAYMWFLSAFLSSLDTVSDTLMFNKIYFSKLEFDENARWAVLVCLHNSQLQSAIRFLEIGYAVHGTVIIARVAVRGLLSLCLNLTDGHDRLYWGPRIPAVMQRTNCVCLSACDLFRRASSVLCGRKKASSSIMLPKTSA